MGVTHFQVELSNVQTVRLDGYRGRAFARFWRIAERRLGVRASGETLEAISSGLSRLLTCRKAGRMIGMDPLSAKGLRQYNLRRYFA